MTYADINRRYTELVAEYIRQGYTINAASMGGSQGEHAKIDLTDGTVIIRVLVQTFAYNDDDWVGYEGVEVVAGRMTDDIHPNSSDTFATGWNQNLDVAIRERFFRIGRHCRPAWYVTEAEARADTKRGVERYKRRYTSERRITVTENGGVKDIAKLYLRRKLGVKRLRENDITVTRRSGDAKDGALYTIRYGSRAFDLC